MPGGRPKNPVFKELGFDLLKLNNKYMAICKNCKKQLQNTAAARLRGHRNICKFKIADDGITVTENPNTAVVILEDDYLAIKEIINTPSVESHVDSWEKENVNIVANIDISPTNENTKRVPIILNNYMKSPIQSTSSIPLLPLNRLESNSSLTKPLAISTSSFTTSFTDTASTSPVTTKLSSRKKNAVITDFVDNISAKEINEINDLLANFIFGCNLPLRIVESKHFKNFIEKIRPAYGNHIPNRRNISTILLDKTFDSCLNQTKSALNSESVLLIDGWKNSVSNSKTVVSMIHTSNNQQAFIDAWDLSCTSETAEKLVDIVIDSIDKAKSLYNTHIYAVVSDNASVMLKMGHLSSHFIWHTTCNSHIANLLAKDILNKPLTDKVMTVMKEFKRTDLEKALIEKGGRRIKLPCETRWCSYRDSYQSFIDNLEYMKLIAVDRECKKIKQNVLQFLSDDEFIDDVKLNIKVFEPICEIINSCQKRNTSIADAVNLWLNLKLPGAFEEQFISNLDARKKMSFNKFSLTAFYLHPYYNEDKLSDTEKHIVYEFLFKHLDGEGIEEWDAFNKKKEFFKTLLDKEIKDPFVFWSMANLKYKKLSPLALKLLQIPASTAQLERLFSRWGYVHSSLRNRLNFERSKKLLHVYYSLTLTENEYVASSEEEEE